jgi:membrane protease YdiL (CAAX protease family)
VRGYGLSVRFVRSEATLVMLIAPVALAIVWLASADQRFLDTYPFYGGDGWSLILFEAAYGATFVALEFFFRGFLVFAGQPVMGVHAVPVMAFAYCLLHLGKPMPEAVSSLIGGLILGYLALRLRSILAGIVAHLTIAWGMDAFVLSRS